MPNGAGDFASLLGRVRGRAGRGRDIGRARVTGAAYEDLENIYAGGEAAEERMGELDVREGRRATRMGRGRTTGAIGGAKAGASIGSTFGPVGAAVGTVAGAGIGSIAGSEFGEKYAFVPGRMLQFKSPFEKRAPAGQVPEYDVPVKFHMSKKAQLNKQISDMNAYIKRSRMQMNQAQWTNAFTDMMNTALTVFATNPQAVSSYNKYKLFGEGELGDFFKPEMWEDWKGVAGVGYDQSKDIRLSNLFQGDWVPGKSSVR